MKNLYDAKNEIEEKPDAAQNTDDPTDYGASGRTPNCRREILFCHSALRLGYI